LSRPARHFPNVLIVVGHREQPANMVDVVGTASAVLALVGAAEATFTTFFEFVKGVGSVDETITRFLRESQNLFSLIRAISKKLDELPADLREDRDLKRLWEPMQVTLKQCKKTIADLTRLFRRLNDTARGRFGGTVIKQIKLQFRDQEIAKLRQQVAWYQQYFQTAMAAMNWYVHSQRTLSGTVLTVLGLLELQCLAKGLRTSRNLRQCFPSYKNSLICWRNP